MKNYEGIEDRRLRINFSDEAFNVINDDMFSFSNNDKVSYSGTICHVFTAFFEQSKANNIKKSKNLDDVKLLLAKKPFSARKGTPSLHKDVMARLSSPDLVCLINEEIYNANAGLLIKAVIEEYAELPFAERERIYFHDTIKEIEFCISKKQLLRVVLNSDSFIVKPYKILTDKHSTYNYLVGFSKFLNSSKDNFEAHSFRVSRIVRAKAVTDSEFSLPEHKIGDLNKKIEQNGIPFLMEEVCDIEVKFTDEGEKLFKQILFQRPQFTSKDGNTFHFSCTKRQAEVYFFKFGEEAKIIKPEELQMEFAKKYARAAEAYKLSH